MTSDENLPNHCLINPNWYITLVMKTYTFPSDINERQLRRRADYRRSALIAAGAATYEIGYRNNEQRIICLCCGLGTSNTHDIRERYCGFCKRWHGEQIAERA